MTYFSIKTQFGVLNGRNSIYLDSVTQSGNKLLFKGELSCNEDMQKTFGKRFVTYNLEFRKVCFYKCGALDYVERFYHDSKSCFDLVTDSVLLKELRISKGDIQHYFLQTYDYIYEIFAEIFEFLVHNGSDFIPLGLKY